MGEQRFFTPVENFTPGGQISPLRVKLKTGLWFFFGTYNMLKWENIYQHVTITMHVLISFKQKLLMKTDLAGLEPTIF
jgi:hypothetical protein